MSTTISNEDYSNIVRGLANAIGEGLVARTKYIQIGTVVGELPLEGTSKSVKLVPDALQFLAGKGYVAVTVGDTRLQMQDGGSLRARLMQGMKQLQQDEDGITDPIAWKRAVKRATKCEKDISCGNSSQVALRARIRITQIGRYAMELGGFVPS